MSTCFSPLTAVAARSSASFLSAIRGACRFAALALLLAFQATGVSAHAESLNPVDEKSIRAAVEGQLAAFAKDDATRAFSFAAPNVRKAVGSAASFMSMVRSDYPVVYRPASVAFLKPEMIQGELIQSVQMTDAGGRVWLALYQMQRQSDRSWRINGCQVVASRDRVT